MHCLFCDDEIILERNWKNLLQMTPSNPLCESCQQGFQKVQGNRCQKCSREHESKLCLDCKYWGKNDPLIFNHSLFIYNETMKEMIAQWKYRGDYILGYAFQEPFKKAFADVFNEKEDFVIVPIPLSKERLLERGFNQAKMLADFLPGEKLELLERTASEKQAKKTRQERLRMENPFVLKKGTKQPVILVDDIYTTGMTLRHASRLLRENGCPQVYSYTFIRG